MPSHSLPPRCSCLAPSLPSLYHGFPSAYACHDSRSLVLDFVPSPVLDLFLFVSHRYILCSYGRVGAPLSSAGRCMPTLVWS